MNDQFKLKVQSREGMLFDGNVDALTSYNEKGKFDVLAMHTNFISLIKDKIEIRDKGQESKEFKEIKFDNALLRVKDNIAEVYLGVEGMLGEYHTS